MVTRKERNWIVVIALLLVLGYGFTQNWFASYGLKYNAITTPPPSTTGPAPTGIFQLYSLGQDFFNPTTAYSCGTSNGNYQVSWYGLRSGIWQQLAAPLTSSCGATSSGLQNIEVTAADSGYVYAIVTTTGADSNANSIYVMAQKTQSLNSRVLSSTWQDTFGTGVKHFVFKFNMFNIPTPTSGYPAAGIIVYFTTFSSTSGTNKFALSNPPTATDTSIGTTAKTEFVGWYGTFGTTSVASAAVQVIVSVNTTDLTKVSFIQLNIPGLGSISASGFVETTNTCVGAYAVTGTATTSSCATYTWSSATDIHDLSQADYVAYGLNSLNQFPFTGQFTVTLASGNKVGIALAVNQLVPQLSSTATPAITAVSSSGVTFQISA